MDMNERNALARRISQAALIVLIGTLLSGPVGLVLVKTVSPQPAWVDGQTFARHYHPLHSVPFWFGIVLLVGFLMFFSALPRVEDEEHYFWGA